MKKIIALLLCCLLCLSLFAACNEDAPVVDEHNHDSSSEAPSQPSLSQEDHSDHSHVNYKGLASGSTTLADVEAAEGRSADFTFEAGGTTYYAYNDVAMDSLSFTQVQYSFHDDYVRISCTYSADTDLSGIYDQWEEYMTGLYGASASVNEDGSVIRWADHTGNYVTLTMLNETTAQLCFYLKG